MYKCNRVHCMCSQILVEQYPVDAVQQREQKRKEAARETVDENGAAQSLLGGRQLRFGRLRRRLGRMQNERVLAHPRRGVAAVVAAALAPSVLRLLQALVQVTIICERVMDTKLHVMMGYCVWRLHIAVVIYLRRSDYKYICW